MVSNSSNTNHFVCILYSKWFYIFIRLTNVILTGTTTLGQRGPGSNGNDGVRHIPQKTEDLT